MILEDYGWDSWFDDQYKSLNMHLTIGRVVGNSEIYKVVCEDGLIDARISDRLFYSTASDSELPVPGDWVLIISDDSDSGYSIYDLLPRRSLLALPDEENPEEQIPAAANVDYILAAVPVAEVLDSGVVENLADMSHDWGAEPVFVCYGSDAGKHDVDSIKKAAADAEIIFIDSIDSRELDKVSEALSPGKTYAVTGVKAEDASAIISSLTGVKDIYDGQHKDGVLHVLPSSAILLGVPLPGDAGFFNDNYETEDGDDFADIIEIASSCKFSDCRHVNEPGCAILEALDNGELDYDYYKSFLKALKKESGRVSSSEQPDVKKMKKSLPAKSEKSVIE